MFQTQLTGALRRWRVRHLRQQPFLLFRGALVAQRIGGHPEGRGSSAVLPFDQLRWNAGGARRLKGDGPSSGTKGSRNFNNESRVVGRLDQQLAVERHASNPPPVLLSPLRTHPAFRLIRTDGRTRLQAGNSFREPAGLRFALRTSPALLRTLYCRSTVLSCATNLDNPGRPHPHPSILGMIQQIYSFSGPQVRMRIALSPFHS